MKLCTECLHRGREKCAEWPNWCYRMNDRTGFREQRSTVRLERMELWPFDVINGTCGRRGRFFSQRMKHDDTT